MAIEAQAEMEETPEGEIAEESVQIPTSLLAGNAAAVGDVIRLEVVDVDDENGVLSVRYHTPKKESKSRIEQMASEYE